MFLYQLSTGRGCHHRDPVRKDSTENTRIEKDCLLLVFERLGFKGLWGCALEAVSVESCCLTTVLSL